MDIPQLGLWLSMVSMIFLFIEPTMKSSRKVQQIIKNPNVALSIWSGKSFSDPYVVIQSRAEVHEDLETKKKYWNPKMEAYFQNLRH